MVRKNVKCFLLVAVTLFSIVHLDAQVKIGDNDEIINAGSLLELESLDKGFMFPRLSLDNDLSVWKLNGDDPADGMVVFNINDELNAEGLYCWYNKKWNLFANDDSVKVRVSMLDSIEALQQQFDNGELLEGDITYVSGKGVYIKNGIAGASFAESFLFMPAISKPGRILYAKSVSVQGIPDVSDFELATQESFYTEPNASTIISVDPPSVSGNNGYYAFAVPNSWANPRIFLKVKNSKDNGFFKLNNCWVVTRTMEYEGVLYQVWKLDIPLRDSVMDIVNSKAQFMIE